MDWKIPVVLKSYADNIPTLLRASDLVMSKAGGLIVTESLAAGLPLLLTEVIEGQESGNAEFIISPGAAVLAGPNGLVRELARWLEEGGKGLCARKRRRRSVCPTRLTRWLSCFKKQRQGGRISAKAAPSASSRRWKRF